MSLLQKFQKTLGWISWENHSSSKTHVLRMCENTEKWDQFVLLRGQYCKIRSASFQHRQVQTRSKNWRHQGYFDTKKRTIKKNCSGGNCSTCSWSWIYFKVAQNTLRYCTYLPGVFSFDATVPGIFFEALLSLLCLLEPSWLLGAAWSPLEPFEALWLWFSAHIKTQNYLIELIPRCTQALTKYLLQM